MRILRLILECATPMHCGGGIDPSLDQPVIRDAYGHWHIPASSIAGALRSLGDNVSRALTSRMFGCQTSERQAPSLIWCQDGLLLDYDGKPALAKTLAGKVVDICSDSFIRDHVRLDLKTGTGVEGGKFDMEIVPAGARFLLEMRCDGWDRELAPEEIDYFDELCALVMAGQLDLGGKSSLGYGQYDVLGAEYRQLELSRREDMEAWLNWDEFAAPDAARSLPMPSLHKSPMGEGLTGRVIIPLRCCGPLLIGGGNEIRPGGAVADADNVFALTPRLRYKNAKGLGGEVAYEAALPASSLRGVLRHALYDILRGLNVHEAVAEPMLNGIFGFIGDESGQCGKISVCDATLAPYDASDFQMAQHVALDRFSGGALDGALYNEEPFWLDEVDLKLKIMARNLEAHEAALFFHGLLNLFEGSLAVGAGANRGNGALFLPHWQEDKAKAWQSIAGDMSWNGSGIFGQPLEKFIPLAQEWDKAFAERAAL